MTVSGANPLVFPSPVSLTGTSVINSNNANVTFNNTLNGAQVLTVTGGSGTTTFTGAVGGTTPLSSLSATAATVTQSSTAKTTGALSYIGSTAINVAGNITTSGGTIGLTGAVTLNTDAVLDTTNGGGTPAGASITASSTMNGAHALTLNGGTGGPVSFGAAGGITPLTSLTAIGATITQSSTAKTTGALSYAGSTAINLGGNMTTSGGTVGLTGPVTLNADAVLDTTNGGGTPAGAHITASSTMNGAHALTLNGGTGGTVSFGAVGGVASLTSLTATGAVITQNSTAKTTGSINYTGTSAINLGGNITTSGGTIGLTGSVVLNADVISDTTNGGGSPAGAPITASSTINGAHALTLNGGTGGAVSFGAVGASTPLTSFTVIGATVTQNSTAKTTGGINYTGASAINISSNITTSGGAITMTGPVNITGTPTFDSTNGGVVPAGANVFFSSTLDGAASLTIQAGTVGVVTFTGAVGGLLL
jgi:hypothetical protein